MADTSKSGSTKSAASADLTADIDDDWALDDDDDAPVAAPAVAPQAKSPPASSATGKSGTRPRQSSAPPAQKQRSSKVPAQAKASKSAKASTRPGASAKAKSTTKRQSSKPAAVAEASKPAKAGEPKATRKKVSPEATPALNEAATPPTPAAPEASQTPPVASTSVASTTEAGVAAAGVAEPSAASDELSQGGAAVVSTAAAPVVQGSNSSPASPNTGPLSSEASTSELPATEDIDSEWPEDDEPGPAIMAQPLIPAAAKVPAEAEPLAALPATGPEAASAEPADERVSARPTLRTEDIGKRVEPAGEAEAKASATDEAPGAAVARSPLVALVDSVEASDTGALEAANRGAAPATATAEPAETTAKANDTETARDVAKPASKGRFFSEPSIERFEAAASAFDEQEAFGVGSGQRPGPDAAAEPDRSQPESLAPSQTDSKPPAGDGKRKSPLVAIGLAAAAVIVAGVGFATRGSDAPSTAAIERAENSLKPDPASEKPKPEAQKPAEPPAPAAEAAPAKAEEMANEATAPDASAAAADEQPEAEATTEDAKGEAESMAIKVNIFPPDAQIYHKGKLLGHGGQTIALKKGERKLLVLIRDGYWPRKLILDGSEKVLNIGLREQPPSTFIPQRTAPAPTGPTTAPKSAPTTAAAPKAAPAPAKPAPAAAGH